MSKNARARGQSRGQERPADVAGAPELRARAVLAGALERLEAEHLSAIARLGFTDTAGSPDLNAVFDAYRLTPSVRKNQRAHALMLEVLDVRRRRHDIWGPRGSRVAYETQALLAERTRRAAGRRKQGESASRRQQKLLQPLADALPKNLSSTAAARRIAASLADDGPKADTIRKLIDRGVIRYRARKLARG
jgi:hypothetical protein